jgi:putative copper export protein
MQYLIGFLHGFDYLCTHFLIGTIIFYGLIQTAGEPESQAVSPKWIRNIRTLIALTFISTAIWMLFSIHDMTETWDAQMLWTGMARTSFSHVLCFKLLFLLFFYLSTYFLSNQKWPVSYVIIVALLLPFGNVLTSHAASAEELAPIKMLLDGLHSLAIGIWTGGLLSLFFWLQKK